MLLQRPIRVRWRSVEVQLEFGKTFEMPLRVLQDVLHKSPPKHTAEKENSDDRIAAVRYFDIFCMVQSFAGKRQNKLQPFAK